MLNKNKQNSLSKERKNQFGNFSRKNIILSLVLLVILFSIWLGNTEGPYNNEFISWLLDAFVNPVADLLHMALYAFFVSLLLAIISIAIAVCRFRLIWQFLSKKLGSVLLDKEKKHRINFQFVRHKFSCWFVRGEKNIRRILICFAFVSWLGYAFCQIVLNSVVLAHKFLSVSYVLTWLLLSLEIVCAIGWDYLRFGHRGFYKGGKHWYEDEKKYLNDGDYGHLGKFLFARFGEIDSFFSRARLYVCDKCGRIKKKVLGKKVCEVNNREKGELKFRSLGEYLYQAYILFRYNSLLYRLIYVFIIVFVILNIRHLSTGEIPSWSSWWNSESRVGEFIQSSTTLRNFLSCPLDNLSFLLLFGLIVEKGARKAFIKSFLYERINMIVVVLSTIVAILLVLANVAQKDLMASLLFADALFTVVFLIEIGLKIYEAGRKYFFKETLSKGRFISRLDWWNITDALVVLLSITSIFMLKDEYQLLSGMYAMIILRVVRLLKLLRLLKIFKKYLANLFEGVKHALIRSLPIIIIFAVCLTFLGFILYLLSAQWGIGEEYFKNPITSVFSLFQLFTYDGWHQIPADISEQCQNKWVGVWWVDTAVRIGFCALVFAGGIVGVALLNSVFVDGMMLRDKSDEDRTRRLNELNRKIEEISTKLDDMEKRRLQG